MNWSISPLRSALCGSISWSAARSSPAWPLYHTLWTALCPSGSADGAPPVHAGPGRCTRAPALAPLPPPARESRGAAPCPNHRSPVLLRETSLEILNRSLVCLRKIQLTELEECSFPSRLLVHDERSPEGLALRAQFKLVRQDAFRTLLHICVTKYSLSACTNVHTDKNE